MRVIRAAVAGDCERIAATHIRSWQAGYARILPASYLAGFELGVWAGRHRQTLQELTPPAAVFVAEVDGVVAGHAWVRDAEIRTLYVDPDHWSGGVGLALLETAVEHLRAHGDEPVHLWVIAANDRARRFYERFGFRADGRSRKQPLGAGFESVPPIEHVRYTLGSAGQGVDQAAG